MPFNTYMNEEEIKHLTDLIWDLDVVHEQMHKKQQETFLFDSLLIPYQLQLEKQ